MKDEAIPVNGKLSFSNSGLGSQQNAGLGNYSRVGLELGVIPKWAESITYYDQCQEVLQQDLQQALVPRALKGTG